MSRLDTWLGWRAERRRRALLRYGRLRAGMLVYRKTGALPADRNAWITAFRAEFTSDGLSDDDIAYSLTFEPANAELGDGWPHVGIDRAHIELEGLASDEPDDIQIAREIDKLPLPEHDKSLARDVIAQYDDLPLVRQRRWRANPERLERLRETLRQAEIAA